MASNPQKLLSLIISDFLRHPINYFSSPLKLEPAVTSVRAPFKCNIWDLIAIWRLKGYRGKALLERVLVALVEFSGRQMEGGIVGGQFSESPVRLLALWKRIPILTLPQ